MGPPIEIDGNLVGGTFAHGCTMLQWGRRSKSTETAWRRDAMISDSYARRCERSSRSLFQRGRSTGRRAALS